MHITSIITYPIKSLGGIEENSATTTPTGLLHDREWMLVDEHGTMITQRQMPMLALFNVTRMDNKLTVSYNSKTCVIDIDDYGDEEIICKLFSHELTGRLIDHQVSLWFSEQLERPVRVIRSPKDTTRRVKNHPSTPVHFSDGCPFLFISEASLRHLNKKLENAIPMNRFRPNIIFSSDKPHTEDTFTRIAINGIEFESIKNCSRCTVTTIDQATGKKGLEPLKTLADYRLKDKKIQFGHYFKVTKGIGSTIQQGNKITLIEAT